MRILSVAIAALSCVGIAVAEEPSSREFKREFSISPASPLEVGLNVGEMEIETADIDKVIVEVEARCRAGSDAKCYRRLEAIEAESRTDDTGTSIKITGVSKRYHRMEVEATVTVPKSSSLVVRMYAGELRVSGAGQDLDVKLKYGDVDVRQPMAATHTALADANFGDAQIYLATGETDPKRPWLVGSRVTWKEGEGAATVIVKLSAGDATVRLE